MENRSASQVNILIVDDDQAIIRILRTYLEQAGYHVLTANDGAQAIHMLRNQKPDLLLLDLMLPDKDGWDITRLIRGDKQLSATPIIMLTARVEDTDKIVGLELGADDYITKPFNAREVVARIKALLRRVQLGQSELSPILRAHDIELDIDDHELKISGKIVELTPTEFNLLQALMENAGHTLSREELLEIGMGYAYEGMGRTLDTHIRNLRLKIEPNPKEPSYIQTVHGVGYRLTRSQS
ncbi:MAG: response regulator transcription factor [Anaerolineales bacterium]|nr:MAG: response regulator transcription factor [Anaerolineales bacterium]